MNPIAVIPVGYPRGRWGKPKPIPARAVTHWNRRGNTRLDEGPPEGSEESQPA